MNIKQLNTLEIKSLFESQMKNDFPADELRPFAWVAPLIEKKLYIGYGLYENTRLTAYALFIKAKNSRCLLLDYYAVSPQMRSSGIGSIFLGLLKNTLAAYDAVIAEVEDPAFAEDKAQLEIRRRRIHFYEKNGFSVTNVRTCVDSVHFAIIYLSLASENINTAAELDAAYKTYMPEDFYIQKVTFGFSSK